MTTAVLSGAERTTREEILDAAETHFAAAGFEGASVREIAADAGLKNQASVYHYFEGKQALYEAVVQRSVAVLLRVVEESRTEAAPDGAGEARGAGADGRAFDAYLDRVLDSLVASPRRAVLFQRLSLDGSAAARDAVWRIVQPLFAEGVRLLGDRRGPWEREEMPHLAAALYHMIFGYFADATLLGGVMGEDPMSAAAIARQRRFVHAAVALLLGRQTAGSVEEETS